MKIEQIIEYIKQLDLLNQHLAQENELFEKHIEKLKVLQTTGKWKDPHKLELVKKNYTAKSIKDAYLKTKVHEGLDDINDFDTILDTFIDFLDKKRDSRGSKK